MEEVLGFVVPGIVLGLGAGLAPGPLLVLVVAHSVRHGTRAGIKVTIAPLITDLPIIGLAVLGLTGVAPADGFLGVIAIAGATFLGYLSYESLTVAPQSAVAHAPRARSLRTGIIANLLNPYPYLFWLTVGAPTVLRAGESGWLAILGFLGSLCGCLIGSKMLLAVAAGRSGGVLTSRLYVFTNRVIGGALAVLALLLLRDGLRYVA